MIDISATEILANVKKFPVDPDINFPENGKFQNPKFPWKFPVPISREETLAQTFIFTLVGSCNRLFDGMVTRYVYTFYGVTLGFECW